MADYKGLTIKFTGDDSDLARALTNIEKKADDAQNSLTLIGSGKGLGLKNAGDALASFGRDVTKLGDKLTLISGAMLITFGRKMVQSVQEFGDEIARVGGYLGISGDQLDYMEELALKFGKDTKYSATEAAQAISELAKGGLTEAQIAGGALDTTLQLAAAGQMDFGAAAKVTAQALKAFNIDAEETTTVADALAGAASNSVASVEGLATGFTYAASWARNAGWSINDVSGALALLADYGIDAEMGGTALRNVMLRMAAPTDKAAGIMKDLGIEVRDAYGNMKSITEVIDEFNIALAGVTPDERDSIISAVFGVRGANAALALLDAGSDKLRTYIGYTQDMGAASRMAQAQLGDLGWAIELMRGEAETASVNFMERLEPTLIGLANAAEDVFSWFNELTDAERDNVVQMALWTVGAGPILSIAGRLITAFGGVGSALGSTVMGFSGLIGAIKAGEGGLKAFGSMIAGFKMVEVSKGVELATRALAGFKLGLVGLGIALAGVAVWKLTEDFRKQAARAKELQERTEKLAEATDALSEKIHYTAPTIENARKVYRRYGEEVDTSVEAVDALAEAHKNLADTIDSRNAGARETMGLLSTAKGIIDEYAGAEHLAADEVAKLQWALDLVNQETGHNYELMYAYSGVIGENGEAVDNLVESLDSLIDARMREAEAAAISANMTDIYKDMYERQREAAALEEDIANVQARIDARQRDIESGFYGDPAGLGRDTVMEQYQQELEDLELSLGSVNAQIDDDTKALGFYTDAYADIVGEIDTVKEKLSVIYNTSGEDVFGGLGDRAEEFVGRIDKALSDAGLAQLDYTSLTKDEWAALVTALNADGYMMEDMLALVTGNLELASADWKATIEEWAESNGISTDVAMQAISDGIQDGSVDISNGLEGVLDSSLGRAKEYVENKKSDFDDAAEEAVGGGMSSGVDKGGERVTTSVKEVRSKITNTLNSMNLWSSGNHAMQTFGGGLDYGVSNYVTPAVANAVYQLRKLEHSRPKYGPLRNDNVWGLHMMQNFASGLHKGIPYVEREIDALTGTLAGSLNDQSLYMSASTAQQVTVINIDGMRVNDDIGIRQNVIDMAYALKAKERGYVGKTDYRG